MTPIYQQLRDIRHQQGITQPEIAEQLGVCLWTVSTWDCGRYSPRLYQYIAYAALVRHQLVITHQGVTRAALADVLPDLAQLRRPYIRTHYLAQRLHVRNHTITTFERRLAAGTNPTMAAVERYLLGFGHDLQLIPMTARPEEVTR